MVMQQLLDGGLIGFLDVGEDEVLRGREAEGRAELLGDRAERGLQLVAFGVLDAAGLDEEAEEPVAVELLEPAEGVALAAEEEGLGGRERGAEALAEFGAEPFDALFLEDVLDAGVLAVGAVTPVAVDGDDGGADFDELFAGDEADDVGEARVGGFVAVGGAETAADEEVVADELTVLDDGHEAHVVGEDVGVVVRRDGEAGLELTRQVGLAVERIHRSTGVIRVGGRGHVRIGLVDGSAGLGDLVAETEVDLDAVHPDGVIGGGGREQGAGNRKRIFVDLHGNLVDGRIGRSGHVTVHVTARGEGGGESVVDRLDQRADALLQHAVELEGLAGSDAEGAIGEATRELVVDDVLGGWDDATGLARAHHDGVLFTRLALVAVILLVDTVELDELLVVPGEAIGFRVGEGFANIARKVGFVRLQEFVLSQGFAGGRVH